MLEATVNHRPVRRRVPRGPAAVFLSVVLPEAAAVAAAAAAVVVVAEEFSLPALSGLLLSVLVLPVDPSAVGQPAVGPVAVPQLPGPAGPTRGLLVGVEGGAIGVAAIPPSSRACGSQGVL